MTMPTARPRRTHAAITGSLALTALAQSAGAITPQVVVHTPDPAPGASANFQGLTPPTHQSPLTVAFFSFLNTGDPGNNQALWGGNSGSLTLAARLGQSLPGLGGNPLNTLGNPTQGRGGEIAFRTVVSNFFGPPSGAAIFAGTPGFCDLRAIEGIGAPGAPGAAFGGFAIDQSINDAGAVAFNASLTGGPPGTGGAIYLSNPGLTLVVRSGDPAPGVANSMFTALGQPSLDSSGRIAFNATVSAPSGNSAGLWRWNAGALTSFVRQGQHAEGYPAAFTYLSGFETGDTPQINASGALAFTGSAFDGSNQLNAIWSGPAGALSRIAAQGDHPPGPGVTGAFTSFTNCEIDRNGNVIFAGSLNTNPNLGLWMHTPGSGLRTLAIVGQPAPGLPAGFTWFGFPANGNFPGHTIDNRGEAVFLAEAHSGGSSISGVWAGRPGRIQKVVAAGDQIDLAPNGVKTVTSVEMWSGFSPDSGRRMGVNDRGEVGVYVGYSGGSAILLYQLPQPCPGDADGNDTVNFLDLNFILSQFGMTGIPGALQGDVNADGAVDFLDLNAVLSFFGVSCH